MNTNDSVERKKNNIISLSKDIFRIFLDLANEENDDIMIPAISLAFSKFIFMANDHPEARELILKTVFKYMDNYIKEFNKLKKEQELQRNNPHEPERT